MKNELSQSEKNEKLILDFHILKTNILDENYKITKKDLVVFENQMEDFFNLKISLKDKNNYLELKKSELKTSFKKFEKYL